MNEVPKLQRVARVAQAFTPSAPVDRLALFAGRFAQINDVASAVANRGQHVALYGERSVGKTSLANVLAELFALPDLPDYQAVLVNCSTEDTFTSVWANVFRELDIAANLSLTPESVRVALARVDPPALVVL